MRRLIASMLTLSLGLSLFFVIYMGATDTGIQDYVQSWFISVMPKSK